MGLFRPEDELVNVVRVHPPSGPGKISLLLAFTFERRRRNNSRIASILLQVSPFVCVVGNHEVGSDGQIEVAGSLEAGRDSRWNI
jgi:hypothetical protein